MRYLILFILFKSHQSAWPFMEPVKRTEAPGYYEVIRFPMGNAIAIFSDIKLGGDVRDKCWLGWTHYSLW